MIINELAVGPLMANCFIVGCDKTREAIVIDPGGDPDRILAALNQAELNLKYIVNTHGHFDHVDGNQALKAATGAPLLIHRLDAPVLSSMASNAAVFGLSANESPEPDTFLEEGDTVEFGEISLKVLHTPGHSPGGISLYADSVVFVGDTLFLGSIGRTDFPGGDFQTLANSIHQKLFPLGDDVTVYTGHGPATTIGREKRTNPFVGLR